MKYGNKRGSLMNLWANNSSGNVFMAWYTVIYEKRNHSLVIIVIVDKLILIKSVSNLLIIKDTWTYFNLVIHIYLEQVHEETISGGCNRDF